MLPDPDFGRPVPPLIRAEVGSGWGPRGDHVHYGIDIALPMRTPVLAVASGVVITADAVDDSPAGRHVAIRHAQGWVTRYLHLERVDVRVGQTVERGQVIGLSGNTGRSSGPHLHLETRVPHDLLPAIEAAVGRPTTGWGPHADALAKAYGVAVPAESWVPVDGYRLTTAARLAAYRIPLYAERRQNRTVPRAAAAGAGVVGLAAAIAVAASAIAWAVRRRRAP